MQLFQFSILALLLALAVGKATELVQAHVHLALTSCPSDKMECRHATVD